LTCRLRIIRGFRRSAFSATSSDFPSSKICQFTPHERGASRFCPVEKALIERLKADAYQSLDEGENTLQSVQIPFVKMSRYLPFNSTLQFGESARSERRGKVFSQASCGGRLSHVASTAPLLLALDASTKRHCSYLSVAQPSADECHTRGTTTGDSSFQAPVIQVPRVRSRDGPSVRGGPLSEGRQANTQVASRGAFLAQTVQRSQC
jgi:hypothetical protein